MITAFYLARFLEAGIILPVRGPGKAGVVFAPLERLGYDRFGLARSADAYSVADATRDAA
jgi:hypothetical protein